VHNHESTYGAVPPAWYGDDQFWNSGQQIRNGALFYSLLPFLEQQNVYNLGQANLPTIGGSPYYGPFEARLQIIKLYLCPSDASSATHTVLSIPPYGTWGWALTSYVGNVMVFDPRVNTPNGAKTIVNAMPDGTSNTVLFAHALQACFDPVNGNATNPKSNEWAWYPWDADYGQWDAPLFGEATYIALNGYNSSIYWTSNVDGTSGADFSSGRSVPPSGIPFVVAPAGNQCNWLVTVSPHTGAMLAGLGDGSVRTVSPGISVQTWWKACVPNDGGVLGSDW
jgi:hypothetical protein